MTQSYFDVPKNDRPNSTHYFVTKIPDKQELQQITIHKITNYSSDNDFHRRATPSLLKIWKSYKRFLKQRLKAFEARQRRAGVGLGGWGAGGLGAW